MDENLLELRQRATAAAAEFIRAQRVYLKVAALDNRKSEAELIEAAENYRKAVEPYDKALNGLREYLLAEEPSEAIITELERTERLIDTLNHEKEIGSKLIEHHTELKAQDIELTRHHAVDEEE
ncbi:MAG TPA: hypothetical protein VJZ77_00585 [Blastocatellia bacterium]|nr:hypothetical protein [Blastocatellia bacterium]